MLMRMAGNFWCQQKTLKRDLIGELESGSVKQARRDRIAQDWHALLL
jgi:hypothetical protein